MSEKEEFESEEEEEEEEEEVAPAAPAAPSPSPAAPSPAPAAESPAPPADEPAEEAAPAPEEPKLRKPPPRPEPVDEGDGMTEAQKAMLAAQKKHEEEDARRAREYEERRANEKLSVEEDLARLKERLAERKAARAEEEAKLSELKRQDEEKHRAEMEARKKEIEDRKRAKEAEMKRSSASCVLNFPKAPTGRTFTPKKKADVGKEHDVAAEGPSEEDLAEMKRQYLEVACKPIELSGLDPHTLKDRVKSLHARLVRLETAKYDLTKRSEAQEYELRELKEREKQKQRSRAKELGLDQEEAAASTHPPKIIVASKFDRQTDKRSYSERYDMYEHPIIPKPPKLYHGTPRPPPEFGHPAVTNEELETLRKTMEPAKGRYVEVAPEEEVNFPIAPIPPQVPDDNAPDEPEPAAPKAAAPADAAPAEDQGAAAPTAKQPREVREAVNPFKAMARPKATK